MRQSPIGPNGPRRDGLPPRTSSRRGSGRWLIGLAVLAALGSPATLRAQENPAPAATSARSAGATAAAPLARYFPSENLNFYFEFAGLDAHAEAWNKTAASKMLTETPLGEMLSEVAAQLVDKLLSYAPGRKLNGPEMVTLFQYGLHHGIAIGTHLRPDGTDNPGDAVAVTLVIRGGASKEIRGLSSRLMGMAISNANARLEKRMGRNVVHLPAAQSAAGPKKEGSAWWAEQDDLVFCSHYPSAVEGVFGAVDGKVTSAVDHPAVRELARKDGSFEPACISLLDLEHAPKAPAGKPSPLNTLHDTAGIKRLALRFGFDDDALMTEFRVVAPRPRKPILALLEQPGFDGKALMPLPDEIDTFFELSVNPNSLLDSIAEIWPDSGIKGKLDEFSESVRRSGKIDFRKDFLGRIGPRMVLFVAPDKSATVGPGTLQTDWLQGFNPRAGIPKAALAHLPKLTLVAEVSEPKTFGRTLEGAINALNHDLTARTTELLEKKEAETAEPGAAAAPGAPATGPGRAGAGRPGGRTGGQRGTRKRPPGTLAPKFVAMQATAIPDPNKIAYILQTPPDSPLKTPIPNFRPVIKFEGRHLVISVDSDSANAALKALKQKGWQPSEDVRKAAGHLPPKMVILAVSDPRDVMPTLLASLPGTLQTIINSVITIARAQAASAPQGGANPPAGAGPGPGGPGGMAGGPGGMAGRRGGPGGPGGMGPGYPGMMRGGSGGPGAGGPAPGAPGGDPSGIPADAMVELKVDSEKLPKAEDLRSRYFLSTLAIVVNDEDVRLVSREAFVSQGDLAFFAGFAASTLPAIQAARAAAQRARAANEEAAAAQSPAAAPGPPGARGRGPGRPGAGGPGGPGPGGAGGPGRGGGRRGRGG